MHGIFIYILNTSHTSLQKRGIFSQFVILEQRLSGLEKRRLL